MNQNYFVNNQMQQVDLTSSNMLNSSVHQKLQQSQIPSQQFPQQQQRSVTPPKRPAMLCRKSSNTPTQNLLLQSSNNKHLINMPSPMQQSYSNAQMWISNINNNQQELINQSSSIQLCNPTNQNIIQQESSSKLLGSTASNSLIQKNSSANSSIVTNSFIPLNVTQGLDIRSSALHQNSQPTHNTNYFQQDQMSQQGSAPHTFANLSIQQQLQEQSFEKCKQSTHHQNSNSNSFTAKNSEYINQDILQQQQSTTQNSHRNAINNEDSSPQNNSMFAQTNFLNNQVQTNIKNPHLNYQESNFSSIKQEVGVIRQYQNQQHQQLQAHNQQQFQQQLQMQQQQLDQSAKTSHKVMMQLSEEIERMNTELKNKNKEYLLLSEKYDILLEDIKTQEIEYQTTLQAKDLMLQQQLQISQRDQGQITTLLQEIDRLTEIVKVFPKELSKVETSGEIRQKIEKLIQMNENLLVENKELGDENTQLNKDCQKYQQEIDNLKKIVSEQAQAVQTIQKKNEKILQKISKSKMNQENDQKEDRSKSNGGEYKKQIQSYEEEIESIKYLLKEKIQEIEYWKCKAQSYQNDYEELESRLQTALKSNEILNNRIMKFSQINFLESVSKEMLSQSTDKGLGKEHNQNGYDEQQEESDKYGQQGGYYDESEQEFDAQKDTETFVEDRYQQLLNNNRLNSLEGDQESSEQNQNPYRKSRYGITSTQYQNRLLEFQNQPLKEQKNSITLRKQNYFTNETIDSQEQFIQTKHSKNKK